GDGDSRRITVRAGQSVDRRGGDADGCADRHARRGGGCTLGRSGGTGKPGERAREDGGGNLPAGPAGSGAGEHVISMSRRTQRWVRKGSDMYVREPSLWIGPALYRKEDVMAVLVHASSCTTAF